MLKNKLFKTFVFLSSLFLLVLIFNTIMFDNYDTIDKVELPNEVFSYFKQYNSDSTKRILKNELQFQYYNNPDNIYVQIVKDSSKLSFKDPINIAQITNSTLIIIGGVRGADSGERFYFGPTFSDILFYSRDSLTLKKKYSFKGTVYKAYEYKGVLYMYIDREYGKKNIN